MHVVLRHENEYDQYGGYFVAVFINQEPISPNGHFGRINNEHTWYTCVVIQPNTLYNETDPVHHPGPI